MSHFLVGIFKLHQVCLIYLGRHFAGFKTGSAFAFITMSFCFVFCFVFLFCFFQVCKISPRMIFSQDLLFPSLTSLLPPSSHITEYSLLFFPSFLVFFLIRSVTGGLFISHIKSEIVSLKKISLLTGLPAANDQALRE